MQIQRQNPQGSGHPGMTNIIVDLYYNNPTMAEVLFFNDLFGGASKLFLEKLMSL